MVRIPETFRNGLRMLRSMRGVAIVAVLTLGVAVNVVVFALVYSVLLRPLPHSGADRLVAIASRNLKLGRDHQMAPLDFFDVERQTTSFDRMAAYYPPGFTLTGTGTAERLPGARASSGIFDVFAVRPMLGRTFRVEEDRPGAPHVVVISHALWAKQFDADSGVVGRSITLSGQAYTVIGVLPADFVAPAMWPRMPDVWVPIGLDPNVNLRDARMLRVIGRLKTETTVEQARADLERIAANLATAYPDTNASIGVSLDPLLDALTRTSRPPLLILVAAVTALLLVAAGNACSLILAGMLKRHFEFATRLALGGSRPRILRQIVLEHLVPGAVAAAAGLLLAYAASNRLAAAAAAAGLPRAGDVHVSSQALAFGIALSAACTVLSTVIAGWVVLGRAAKAGLIRHQQVTPPARGLSTLLAAEAAFSFALLAGGLLLVQSFYALRATSPGFDQQDVWTLRLSPPSARYPAGPVLAGFYDRVLASVRTQSGVDSAALVDWLPASGSGSVIGFTVPGPGEQTRRLAELRIVSHDYFRTLAIPRSAGRLFDDRDRNGAQHVTIVNEAFAHTVFGTTDVVGRHLTFDKGGLTEAEIVGVTRDVREISRRIAPQPAVYLPRTQQPWLKAETRELILRMDGGRVPSLSAIQQIVRDIDSDVPIGPIVRLDSITSSPIVRSSVYASAVAINAGITVLLVAFGIYGTVSAVVAERTRQIGICIALGATSLHVTRDLGRHGVWPIAVGLVVGVPLAFGAGHLVRQELFGIEPTDPTTFALVAMTIFAVGITASLIPAARAVRIDPARTLRHDTA